MRSGLQRSQQDQGGDPPPARLDDMLRSPLYEQAARYVEHAIPGLERSSPVISMLAHIGNYWGSAILLTLRIGPVRPSVLRDIINTRPQPPISRRMLSLNLRALERDGLVERRIFHSGRARVEYSLTDLGRMLSHFMVEIAEWGTCHVSEIVAAREGFDSRNERPGP